MAANQTFFELITILFLISWFITIIFSVTIIAIITYHWRTGCRSIINLLTCNSSVALIFYVITAFVQMPTFIQYTYFNASEPNPLVCKIYACLGTFGVGAIASSGLIQAVSRFFIMILYKHKFLLTFPTNWILIMISWISSAIIAGLLSIFPTGYQFEPESHFCTLTTNNFLTSFLAVCASAIFPMTVMIILYGIILNHTIRHTRTNPNTAIALQAKRNEKVFKRIITPLGIFGIGGTPYLLCIILNRIDRAPWPLYSIGFLAISLAAAISSIALLITNDQVKRIFITKLIGRRTNVPNNVTTTKRNQIVPQAIVMRTLQPLPVVC